MLPSSFQARRLGVSPTFTGRSSTRHHLVVRAATAVPAKVRLAFQIYYKKVHMVAVLISAFVFFTTSLLYYLVRMMQYKEMVDRHLYCQFIQRRIKKIDGTLASCSHRVTVWKFPAANR